MANDGSAGWLTLIAILPVVYYIVSLRERVKRMEKKVDLILQNFDGLRLYLYEIDPQFEDERQSENRMNDPLSDPVAAHKDFELIEGKEAAGKRTRSTTFAE
jgi:hypothetical protein